LFPYILTFETMLAKLTSKNQLTLPKQALEAVGVASHFRVEVEDGRIVLTPERLGAADAVRRKLEELGITEADVADAVAWARQRRR
jgi:bifunctional DNA-binding transcriptional regulator/antitoxin component of YhaV-PrlF toxin-antitoxin module